MLKKRSRSSENTGTIRSGRIFAGGVFGLLLTIALTFSAALAVTREVLSQNCTTWLGPVIIFVSAFFSALTAAHSNRKKLLCGLFAAHEDDDGYWGGEIITQNKMTYKYGYIEYSCITPDGDGMWSLLWLCGMHNGYANPEIDVNECFGNASATAANCHAWPTTAGTNEMGWEHTSLDGHGGKYSAKKYYCPDGKHFGEDFHTFGFLWDEDEMTFTADGKIFFSYTTNTTEQDIDAFVDDPMFVRIGMSFGRLNNNLLVENLTDWERENTNKFIVDWIHLYQMDDAKYIFDLR